MDDIKIFEGDEIRYMDDFSDEEFGSVFQGYNDLLVKLDGDRELVVVASKNPDRQAVWNAYQARFPDTKSHFGFITNPEALAHSAAIAFGLEPS